MITYYFDSIEEMQADIQANGPLEDGVAIVVDGERIR